MNYAKTFLLWRSIVPFSRVENPGTESHRPSVLHQDAPEGIHGSVCIDMEGFGKVWEDQDRRSDQSLFQLIESVSLYCTEKTELAFPSEQCQRPCHMTVSVNEPSEIVREPQEGL
jgi:hypothetical protein